MDFSLEQTIAARACPQGTALRAIVRVSGPACRDVVGRVFHATDIQRFQQENVAGRHVGVIHAPGLRLPIPAAAYLWPTVRSYTGQPLVELHLPGAPPLVEAVLQAIFAAGAAPARAGEFTLRAFLAGRINLLQAEAVLGIIDAPDEVHLKGALAQLAGGISSAIAAVHEQLLFDLADLEAGLDFADEDIEFVDRVLMQERLNDAESLLERLGRQATDRMHTAPAARVVLAGLPNAGKSTLFNALLNRDAALVSSRSGTTRDYLAGRVNWNGWHIELVDTPGWEAATDEMMNSAANLRQVALDRARIVVWCRAADAAEHNDDNQARLWAMQTDVHLIATTTKADLAEGRIDPSSLSVSSVTGEGVEELRQAVLSVLGSSGPPPSELIGSTAARCADSIRRAGRAVRRARYLLDASAGDELVAAELRTAIDEIGRVTGRIHSEDILDRIFSRFCIGK